MVSCIPSERPPVRRALRHYGFQAIRHKLGGEDRDIRAFATPVRVIAGSLATRMLGTALGAWATAVTVLLSCRRSIIGVPRCRVVRAAAERLARGRSDAGGGRFGQRLAAPAAGR